MGSYVLKRLFSTIPVFIGLSLIVFLIMAMIPGNPAQALLGAWATPENVARINQELGLNKPLYQQYLIWAGNILHGDFGRPDQILLIQRLIQPQLLINTRDVSAIS